jgi:hypothetical protein
MADSPLGRRMRGFVYELSRGRVFRVLLAYTVFGGGAAAGAYLFMPALDFPAYAVNLVVILLALGLPVAVGLAWAFDVVPDQGPISADAHGSTGPLEDSAGTDRLEAAEHE